MRFRSAVLLATLVIAPICAECIKDSDERHVIDSTLSADGVDCSDGGLRSSGNNSDGGGGCDTIRRRTAGGVAVGWEKKDAVVVGGEGGDGDDGDNVRASGIGDDSTVIAFRQLLRGGEFRVQHSSEAMFAAIAFVGAAVAAVVSRGDVGGSAGGGVAGGGIVVPVGGLDSQAQQGSSGPISPRHCWPLPPLPCVVNPPPSHRVVRSPPAFLFDCCVLDRQRRGGKHGGRAAAEAAAAQRRRRRQRGNGGSAAAARRWRGVGGGGGGSLAAARRQRGGGGSFPSAWRR